MIYTSIILLTVLKIFSLNEWENVSQFLTDFLWRVSSVIVLWVCCWYCHTYRTSPWTSQFSPHFTIDWHCSSLYNNHLIIWSSLLLISDQQRVTHLDSDDWLGLLMEDGLEGRRDLHREVHGVWEDVWVQHGVGLLLSLWPPALTHVGPACNNIIDQLQSIEHIQI